MTLRLSILDQSPVISGHTPARAVAETVKLAQSAEALGYHPYCYELLAREFGLK